MYAITVIPVSRGTTAEELSYFSALDYPLGSLLRIPLRGRTIPGIVLRVETVRDAKALLRSSDFALRKIKRQTPRAILLPEFIRALETTSRHFAATSGAVLYAYLPLALRELLLPSTKERSSERPRLRGFIIPRLYQGLMRDRIDFYRTSVRETFAANGSVFLVAPTIADATRVFEELSGGIERYVFLLHGGLRRTMQRTTIESILTLAHPVLVVLTPAFLSLPRHDLTTIIIEREGSSQYRTPARPFVDTRVFAQHYASQLGGQLYLADLPLRIESVHLRERGEYEEIVTGHQRMQFSVPTTILSRVHEGRQQKKPFQAIGAELWEHVQQTVAKGHRVFLYAARRGLSPCTVCNDCGTTVVCRECGAPVVLHRGTEENYFLCHACGSLRHARERCTKCQSWRLEALGIGTELVGREVEHAGYTPLILSADTARTHTAAYRLAEEFSATRGGILIGTELALPYVRKQVSLVGVVSLDSLLSLSNWNVYERIASTLTRLHEIAGEAFVLQTRHPDADILKTVLAGNFSSYYKHELNMRKSLGYPPYTVLIKVSAAGTKEAVVKRMEEARTLLAPFELVTFSRILRSPGGAHILHGFIRLSRERWPDEDLLERLRALPPSYTIMVDPDSVL